MDRAAFETWIANNPPNLILSYGKIKYDITGWLIHNKEIIQKFLQERGTHETRN